MDVRGAWGRRYRRQMLAGLIVIAATGGAHVAPALPRGYHLVPGAIPWDKGPDGNSILIDAPGGLIVVDTGRHPDHAKAILDAAKNLGKPVAAIVNTHWHLDHVTGNWDIRRAFRQATVYASPAIDGALQTFLRDSRAKTEAALADPQTSPAARDQYERAIAVVDHPERIRPTRPVGRSAPMLIAGRMFDVRIARFAATEGDLWLFDRRSRIAIVGDLVVGIVPFMDTACPNGWKSALKGLAATPFTLLIPGHGAPMTKARFLVWKAAFDRFVDCGYSSASKARCIDGWMTDAAGFIDRDHRSYAREAAAYYLDSRLRAAPEERLRYCKPLRA